MRTPVKRLQHASYTEVLTRVAYQCIRLYYHHHRQLSNAYPPFIILSALYSLPSGFHHLFTPFFVGAAKWVSQGVTLAEWRYAYPEMRGYRRLDKLPVPIGVPKEGKVIYTDFDRYMDSLPPEEANALCMSIIRRHGY